MAKNPIKKGDILKIYTDGAVRSNPGPAICAFLFVHNDEIIHEGCNYIGTGPTTSRNIRQLSTR